MGFVRVNEFLASDGCEEDLTALLSEVTRYLLGQPGCSGAELLVSDDDDARLVVIERWESKEAHHNALSNYPKDKMAAARAWFAQPPRGQFYVSAGEPRGSVH